MTHQWKPGDRGVVPFTFVDSDVSGDGLVRVEMGPKNSLCIFCEDEFSEAEFVAPAMPKPGEWTGPGLTPIYEVRVNGNWRPVLGEYVGYLTNRHTLFVADYAAKLAEDISEWRRIGDSE